MKSITVVSLVTLFLGLGAAGVAAQPPVPEPQGMQAQSGNVLQADWKKYKKKKEHRRHQKWVYNEKYGHRYRHRRDGFVYFHDGWWYERPYWDRPGITINLGL